jgi:hypothetical protein
LADTGDVLAYERAAGEERRIVCLNLGSHRQPLHVLSKVRRYELLLSTRPDRERGAHGATPLELLPGEGLVIASLG